MKLGWTIAAVVAVVLAGGGITTAATSDSQGKINTCINDATAVVRIVDATKPGSSANASLPQVSSTKQHWRGHRPDQPGQRGPSARAAQTAPRPCPAQRDRQAYVNLQVSRALQGTPGQAGAPGASTVDLLAGHHCPTGQVLTGFTDTGDLACSDPTPPATTGTLPDADGDGIPDVNDPCPAGPCDNNTTTNEIRSGNLPRGIEFTLPDVVVVAIDPPGPLGDGQSTENFWIQDITQPPGPSNGLYVTNPTRQPFTAGDELKIVGSVPIVNSNTPQSLSTLQRHPNRAHHRPTIRRRCDRHRGHPRRLFRHPRHRPTHRRRPDLVVSLGDRTRTVGRRVARIAAFGARGWCHRRRHWDHRERARYRTDPRLHDQTPSSSRRSPGNDTPSRTSRTSRHAQRNADRNDQRPAPPTITETCTCVRLG